MYGIPHWNTKILKTILRGFLKITQFETSRIMLFCMIISGTTIRYVDGNNKGFMRFVPQMPLSTWETSKWGRLWAESCKMQEQAALCFFLSTSKKLALIETQRPQGKELAEYTCSVYKTLYCRNWRRE